jgi:hypothetical protein
MLGLANGPSAAKIQDRRRPARETLAVKRVKAAAEPPRIAAPP